MNSARVHFVFLLYVGMLFVVRCQGAEICPSISLTVDQTGPICSKETMTVGASFTELPGLCEQAPVTYLDKQWTWSVEGVVASPSSGQGSSATFTNLSGGEGAVTFALQCRVRACRDCNATFAITTNFTVIKVDIAESDVVLCSYDTSATLSLTGDSYSPDGYLWKCSALGIDGDGDSVSFNPSEQAPGIYTVSVRSKSRSACSDVCRVRIVQVDLDVDCNRDGVCDEDDEDLEDSPGGLVGVNNDDDNANGTNDLDEVDVVVGENDLIPIHLRVEPNMPSGAVILDAPAGGEKIKVWKTATKGEEVHLPMTWYPGAGTVPEVRYIEGIQASDQAGDVRLRLRYQSGAVECSDEISLSVLKIGLVPDWNRDKKIDSSDENQAAASNPFRFWKNDDDDLTVDSGNDIPGNGSSDSGDSQVDSVRDLIDFFPVFVDLKDTLDLLGTTDFSYALQYNLGGIGFVYTDLTPANAGDYLTDETTAENLAGETVNIISGFGNGFTLDLAFLSDIQNNGKGIILVEADASSTEPLVLNVIDSSDNIVCSVILDLSISGVEDMYRHKNLRTAVGQSGGAGDRLGPPANYPDALTIDKHFAFLHGFNVSGDEARCWHAEVFKRMYWSGSNAKFHGITWYGNQTDIGPATLNYHINVKNSFEAAAHLKAYLDDLSGDIIVAGHSMGNLVLSAAIEDEGLSPDKYIMINAAVALEAYDAGLQNSATLGWEEMMHCDWRVDEDPNEPPLYDRRLWASDWYKLFLGTADERRKLTWENRFDSVAGVGYHFYSTGEDVLENFEGGDGCFFVWEGGLSRGAWVKQEKLKGRTWFNVAGSDYGGWGFNDEYDNSILPGYQKPDPATVNGLPVATLQTDPFFLPGPSSRDDLYDATLGSTYAANNHAELIGGMISALTYPAGANELLVFNGPSEIRNFDMNSSTFQNGWPRSEPDWLHSDIKDVAYPYVYRVFKKIVEVGRLHQ